MTVYSFQSNAGTSITFNPGDVLEFAAYMTAADLRIRADGADTIIMLGALELRLVNASYASLQDSNFAFLNGSVARLGPSNGADTLTGTSSGDYLDIAHADGGNDVVDAGQGADVVFAGDTLNALDQLDGGLQPSGASDTLIVSGGTVTLGATTVTGFEEFRVEGTASITLHQNTLAGGHLR